MKSLRNALGQAALALVLLVSPALGADGASKRASSALVLDVARVVAAEQAEGWFSDVPALERTSAALLQSVCLSEAGVRTTALALLRQRAKHGSARRHYAAVGEELTASVQTLLTRERELATLERTLLRLSECPFYAKPRRDFVGLQSESYKWTLHLEGGGLGELARSQGQLTIGGGAAGRLLLGRGFESHSLLGGLEVTGSVAVPPAAQSQSVAMDYAVGAPVVLRFREALWLYDIELSPLFAFSPASWLPRYGGRLGLGVGIATLKTRGLLPWAGVFLTAEQLQGRGEVPTRQSLRGGFRVGLRFPG